MRTTEARSFRPRPVHGVLRVYAVVLLFLGVVSGQPVGAATHGTQAFDQGLVAFRAGNYHAALQSFLDARRAGLDTLGLSYNIGVTYYRLRRYPQAEREFQALARDPQWAALAHYNLGLTAQRMERAHQAIEHFEQAHRTTTDGNLRILAATALERLRRGPPLPQTTVVASLAGGYDSNVSLSQLADTVGLSNKGDGFLEALAAASHRLDATSLSGSYVHGSLYLRNHLDLNKFDQLGVRAGVSHETDSGRWQTSVGGYLDMIYVDGERLQEGATLDLQVRRHLDAARDLRGRYQLGRITAGGAFQYLDGWQHRLLLDAGVALAPAFVRVGYQLEYDDRKDLQQGDVFFSYSPTQHTLFASAAWPSVGGWRTDARGEYRTSRYHDPDRLDDGTRKITRKDTRYGALVRASRRWTGIWQLFIDYSYYRNSSNLDAYGYTRHQVLAGTEAAF
jgi:tetratricopeptide (TPR) repeat protein